MLRDLNFADWLAFVAIVEEKSFTSAANKLDISPSVLSKRISRLEKQLKARLLQRTTRQLILTEIGQLFYERCQKIRGEIQDTTLTISQIQQQPQGTLRINSPMTFGHLHLVPAISEFMRLYPELRVELVLGSHYANLIEGSLDLAIYTDELPDSSLVARRIALRSTRVYGSPSYFAKYGIPQQPQDLKQHNCLLYQLQPTRHEWRFHNNGEEEFVKVNGDFKANSSQALAAAAVSGLGIVKLPGYMVTEDIQTGRLISVLKDYCPRDTGIYVVYPQNRYLSINVRTFIDYLVQRFSSERYWNED